jgi:O-antigen/teichoic acid export membrane protein
MASGLSGALMNKVQLQLSKIELLAVYLGYAFRYLYPLILLPYYGRVLGADGYSVVLAGMSLSNSLWLFTNYGFSTIGARDVVLSENEGERDRIFREQFTARLLMCVPAVVAGIGAVSMSPIFARIPGVSIAVVAMGLVAAFNLGWYFMSTGRARTSVLIEVVGFLLSLSMIFLFIRKPEHVARVFPVLLVSSVVQLLSAYWLLRGEFSGFVSSLRAAIVLIKRSTTIFIYGGTSVLLIGASTYILSLLAPVKEVSAFGVSERLVAAALSLMGPAAQILVPRVMFLVGRDQAQANLMARKIFAVFFLGAVAGAVVTRLLSGWAVPLIFGPEFRPAVPVLDLLVLVLPVSVCTQILGLYFLIPRKFEGLLARCGIIGALLNLAAAIPLAHYRGAIGMAEARLLGEVGLLAALLIGIWRAGMIRQILEIVDKFPLAIFGRWTE